MSHLMADMKDSSDLSELQGYILFQPYVHFWMNIEMNLDIQEVKMISILKLNCAW